LFAGGRVRAQSGAARANRHSAELGLTAQETQLTLDVTQAYYDAALSDRLLDIARTTLELADSTFEQTKLARQVGAQAEFDLLKAQVSRDNQRPVVIQRETDRDIAYLKLRQLLNLPLDQPVALTTLVSDSVLPSVPLLDSLQAINSDTAAEARVAVRQAELALKAQEAQFKVARAERWPTVTLSSNFARLGYPSDLIPSWNDFVSDWTVGVALKVPLFTGGRIAGSVMSAGAQLDDSRLRLSQTREKVAVDNRTVFARRRQAEAQWLASQGTVGQAARAYAIAEIRYREGISTQTELTEARVQLEQARANLATAARDVQIARVKVALLANLPL
jgi:outer membrane protein TolC